MTRTQLLYPHNGRPFGELESAADCVPRRRGALRREVFKTLKVRHTDRRPFVDPERPHLTNRGANIL